MGRKKARPTDLDAQALTFVVEAQGDPTHLAVMKQQIRQSPAGLRKWGKDAVRAIEHAEAHLNELRPVADLYEQKTGDQLNLEKSEGYEVDARKGYVFHMQEQEPLDVPFPSRGQGSSTAFKHERTYDTFADSIAAGKKYVSINAMDALQSRLRRGGAMIGRGKFAEVGRGITDNLTGKPLIADMQVKTRVVNGAPQVTDVVPPKGYVSKMLGNKPAAVLEGYSSLYDALTGNSVIQGSTLGRGALAVAGGIKHGLLLFDLFHAGRLALYNTFLRGSGTYRKGLNLLDNTVPELHEMARRGQIPQEYLSGLVENKRVLDLLVKQGYNVGGIEEQALAGIVKNLPVIGKYNHWLFQEFQRGTMAQSGLIEFNRLKRASGGSDDQVARDVAKQLNTRFGNLKAESWIKSQTMKDLSRLILLAPSWNEGLLRSELGSVMGVLKTAMTLANHRRLVVGSLTKGTATAILATFAANQLLNYATRGKPTWENEEDGFNAKISAYIPDWVGNGPGFFINPLALPAEITHSVVSKLEQNGQLAQSASAVLSNKLSPVWRAVQTLLTQHDRQGHPIRGDDWEVAKQAMTNLVPVPIPVPPLLAAYKSIRGGRPIEQYPGEMQRQGFSSLGIKLDQAPGTESRIHSLAAEFRKEKGLAESPEYNASDYTELTAAVRQGDRERADKAMEDLAKKKTHEQIVNHFRERVLHPFTGSSLKDEKAFYNSLDSEQKQTYDQAVRDRAEISKQALDWYAKSSERLHRSTSSIPSAMHQNINKAALKPKSLKPHLARKEL